MFGVAVRGVEREHALEEQADVVFVGDTWGPDIEGPRGMGMCAFYLERDGHWPDTTLPATPAPEVMRIRDLAALAEQL